jgi:hypothetical protein
LLANTLAATPQLAGLVLLTLQDRNDKEMSSCDAASGHSAQTTAANMLATTKQLARISL